MPAELIEPRARAGLSRRWRSPTNARWPAWCARTWRAKQAGLPLIIGAEFTLECGLKFVALAATRRGYGQICQLITRGRRAAPKGSYRLTREDLADCIAAPPARTRSRIAC